MLSDISKISISNFSFIKELYSLLHSFDEKTEKRYSKLLSNFNKIISLQRELFNLQYGTLEQIGFYLLKIIKNTETKEIEIIDKDTLLEYIIYKILLIDIQYIFNIEEWVSATLLKNNNAFNELKESLYITSENISHFNIIHLVEIMDKLYLPDRSDFLTSISDRFVTYYNHQLSTEFQADFYIIAIGNISDLSKYLFENFKEILKGEYNLDNLEIIKHPIFIKNNFVESFLEAVTNKSENELEFAMKSLDGGFNKVDIAKIYNRLLKLSEVVIATNDHKLLVEFQDFTKFIDSVLNKK